MLDEARVLSQVRRQQGAPAIGDPAAAASLSRPLRPDRNRGRRGDGTDDAQDLEDALVGVVEHERRAVEGDHGAQRRRGRPQEGVPIETGHHGVVHLQEHPPALLGAAQLRRSSLHEPVKIRAEGSQLLREAPRLDLGHDRSGETSEDLDLLLGPHMRSVVDDAEGAEGVSFGRGQRDSGVGDDAHLGYRRIVLDERMLPGVRYHELLTRRHGVLAERVRQRGLSRRGQRLRHPDTALEELTIPVDQRHHRDRHAQRRGRQPRQAIEGFLGGRIQQRGPPQSRQPRGVQDDLVVPASHAINQPNGARPAPVTMDANDRQDRRFYVQTGRSGQSPATDGHVMRQSVNGIAVTAPGK